MKAGKIVSVCSCSRVLFCDGDQGDQEIRGRTEVPPTKSVVGIEVTGTFPRLYAIAGKRPVCHQPCLSPALSPALVQFMLSDSPISKASG
jgi:hypothetical protein